MSGPDRSSGPGADDEVPTLQDLIKYVQTRRSNSAVAQYQVLVRRAFLHSSSVGRFLPLLPAARGVVEESRGWTRLVYISRAGVGPHAQPRCPIDMLREQHRPAKPGPPPCDPSSDTSTQPCMALHMGRPRLAHPPSHVDSARPHRAGGSVLVGGEEIVQARPVPQRQPVLRPGR
jgi:hypothetical protein